MKRVCAWCGREMPPKEGQGDVISHGICEDCADQLFPMISVPLERYLDRLEEPVVVVDANAAPLFLNRKAQGVLGTSPSSGIQRKDCEVFDCAHSRLPEGCGRSIHCSGCVIRRAVTSTHATGESQARVPATLSKGDPDHAEAVALTITTVKKGDVVLLRIDHMGAE